MGKTVKIWLCLLAVLTLLASCGEDPYYCPPYRPATGTRTSLPDDGYNNVFLLYLAGYNNLKSDLETNIRQMINASIPTISSKDVVVVFSHLSKNSANFSAKTNPVIYRLYKRGPEDYVKDTLICYSDTVCSANEQTVAKALLFVRDRFPAKHYGMLITSHGTGWIPGTYNMSSEERGYFFDSVSPNAIGVQQGTAKNVWMDSDKLAQTIPFHLDYIIFDACLMSSIEVLYQFKGVCDKIVASPTEVLTDGFCYESLCQRVFAPGGSDLEGVCKDYIESRRYATIALLDCAKIDTVASACKAIFSAHGQGVLSLNLDNVQSYNVSYSDKHFDLRDFCRELGANSSELEALDGALKEYVLYKNTTSYFLGLKIDPKRYCGINCYIPSDFMPKLNELYLRTSWAKETGLLKKD